MKTLFVSTMLLLLFNFGFVGARSGNAIPVQDEETPRMKCLKKCNEALLKCTVDAKGDATKKSACNKAVAKCLEKCPAPQQ